MRKGNGFRFALSLLIAFHVFAVLVAPNIDSDLGRGSRSIVGPYIELLELTNLWSFFAPEPGPPTVYLEYAIEGADGNTLTSGRWPETDGAYFFKERQVRRIAAVEFMVQSDVRMERMMLPYLCSANPGASAVTLWRTWNPVPSMEEVRVGAQKLHDPERAKRELLSHSFCVGARG